MHPTHIHSHSHKSVNQRLLEAEQLCESRGKRLTPIRQQVLRLMLEESRSLKAYELLDAMLAIHPKSKPPTVYRALEFLEEEGLIHRLDAVNAWTACIDVNSHHHDLLVVCTQCGKVVEISAPEISSQLKNLIANTGFSLTSNETEIRATCAQCKAKNQPQDNH